MIQLPNVHWYELLCLFMCPAINWYRQRSLIRTVVNLYVRQFIFTANGQVIRLTIHFLMIRTTGRSLRTTGRSYILIANYTLLMVAWTPTGQFIGPIIYKHLVLSCRSTNILSFNIWALRFAEIRSITEFKTLACCLQIWKCLPNQRKRQKLTIQKRVRHSKFQNTQ